MGAGQYTCRRRYITIRGFARASRLIAFIAALPGTSAAQRVLERHAFSDPEGRLLAFYSAAMAFSPAGVSPDETRLSVSLEVSHVPYLNTAQRRPSIDKPESTNLAPFFPRPRGALRLGSWIAEASWIPPVPLFDVEANLISAAIVAPRLTVGTLSIAPRVWGTFGRVKGSMTCSSQTMVGHGADLELYYSTVCHGRESEDWFEPRMLAGEGVISRSLGAEGGRLYAVLGARVDRTRFDIGVLTFEGARDQDHPILQLHSTRPHAALGASFRVRRGILAGAELFYAPGSLLTGRVSGKWIVRQ